MANSPTDIAPRFFAAPDGTRLAWREMGAGGGRPVVMIHGYASNAMTNWVRYGHAALLADAGFRVLMPDLRGHGDSEKPRDPAAWPADVLAADGHALVAHLGLTDYDLAGYSLGGRTAIRMLATGATPGRVIVAGMGLEGILHTAGRGVYFRRVFTNLGSFPRGSSEWMTEAFLKTTGADPQALLHALDTFVDTPASALAAIDRPVLVVTGADDDDNGSGRALADALAQGSFREIPGNHMSAVTKPELGTAIRDFLDA